MGLLDLIKHKTMGSATPEEDRAVEASFASQALYRNQTAQQTEDRQNKGIDIDMIDPEEIVAELQALAHYTYPVVVKKIAYREEKDQLVPYVAEVEETREGIRPWAIAVLGYLNKVWPTIWMGTYEADTQKLVIRTAFHDIRKTMTYDEKKQYGIILRMARDLCIARCEDMKDGRKDMVIKIRSEKLEVSLKRGIDNTKNGGK